jgi:hypothetical protein
MKFSLVDVIDRSRRGGTEVSEDDPCDQNDARVFHDEEGIGEYIGGRRLRWMRRTVDALHDSD